MTYFFSNFSMEVQNQHPNVEITTRQHKPASRTLHQIISPPAAAISASKWNSRRSCPNFNNMTWDKLSVNSQSGALDLLWCFQDARDFIGSTVGGGVLFFCTLTKNKFIPSLVLYVKLLKSCVCIQILVTTFPEWLSGTEPLPHTPGAVRPSSLCL